MTLSALRFHTNVSPLVAAVQERRLLQALLEGAEGKLGGGTGFQVNPNTGKQVRIEPCTSGLEQLIINGTESPMQGAYALQLDAVDTSVTLDPAPSTNSRIDVVIAHVDDAEYSGGTYAALFDKVTGVESGSPAVPDAAAAGYENFHVLAEVLRTPGEPANLAASAFTNRVFPCYFGGMVHLGTAVGDDVVTTLAVEWDNDARIQALWFSGRIDSDDTGNFEQAELYVNDDTGPNYSIFRHDAVRGVANDWEGADNNNTGFLFRVGGNGGGINGHAVNAQNPADCMFDFRTVSRWGTGAADMRRDEHSGLYKPGGPITKLSLENLGVGWSTEANFRVWGFLESL